ncbi:MAG TPA: hypothetical protein PKO09_00595 [Anaerolineae bacterium]|nr:hypothetical protein [Anaerolineae bacterium]
MSDINHYVEKIEKLVSEGWRIPMSAYVIVNEEEMLELIDQLRTAIPKEMRQANRIVQERDRILSDAEVEAEQKVQEGRQSASRLAEQHEVVAAANVRAQTIIERAQREAEILKSGADEYAAGVLQDLDGQLGTLESQIGRLTSIVRAGLAKLAKVPEQSGDPDEQE